MRNLHLLDADRRTDQAVVKHYGGIGDHETGVFEIPSKIDRAPMMVIASAGMGWDHVSVSRKNRTPNWVEMCQVKELFFKDEETVMQLHVPSADHINVHPFCLHLWRPHNQSIPRPPSITVGTKELEERYAERRNRMEGKSA